MAVHAEGIDVVVTIKPIHSLVAQVMEGVAAPTLLVEGSASPHSFSLKPSQVRAIDTAGVFIRVSERLEPFTGKIVRSLPDERATRHARRRARRQAAESSADRDLRAPAARPRCAGPQPTTPSKDSHIWLDPDNAKAIGHYVGDVLERALSAACRAVQGQRRAPRSARSTR